MAEAINNYHPDALPTIRSSAAEAIRRMIFQGTLRSRLEVGGCMERLVIPPSSSAAISKFPYPIYVAHAKRLRRRREHITKQLAAIGAADVTLVLCADASAVAALDARDYKILHPQYTRTAWSPASRVRLPNGTLSLALKHRMAHLDISRRGLPAALVVEDDAVLPPALPQQLRAYTAALPSDASLFFIGSYSRSTNPRLTLSELPIVPHSSPTIHRRINGSGFRKPPHIIGTVAYLVLARGAQLLSHQPIRAEADVDLSLLAPTDQCGTTSPRCAVASPPVQYGPSQWLAWQDESLSKELTHGSSKSSVSDGWRKACRNRRPADVKLQRACRKFGFAT